MEQKNPYNTFKYITMEFQFSFRMLDSQAPQPLG